jgi:hypothetical protein
MHVRVELGQEAVVATHVADGTARRRPAPAGSGSTSWGPCLAAPQGSNGDPRRWMCGASVGAACDRLAAL